MITGDKADKRFVASFMDTSRISVSALGRDVVVGDLYNYYTDDIMKSKIFI